MSCLISPNGIWSLQSRPLVPVGRSLVSCCIGTAHGEVVVCCCRDQGLVTQPEPLQSKIRKMLISFAKNMVTQTCGAKCSVTDPIR